MDVQSFAELEAEFTERVNRMVWCNVATIDTQNRPRSRILHPFWERSVGWITTDPNSHKAKHFKHNPYTSLAYVADITKPVYVDCKVEWVDDRAEKQRLWDLIKATPEPMGFDPEPIYKSVDGPRFGLLKLIPWRIEVYNFPGEKYIWRG